MNLTPQAAALALTGMVNLGGYPYLGATSHLEKELPFVEYWNDRTHTTEIVVIVASAQELRVGWEFADKLQDVMETSGEAPCGCVSWCFMTQDVINLIEVSGYGSSILPDEA